MTAVLLLAVPLVALNAYLGWQLTRVTGRLSDSRDVASGMRVRLESIRAERDELRDQCNALRNTWRDADERYNARLAALRAELADMEADLANCSNPAVLARRIERLFGITEGASDNAQADAAEGVH